MEKRLAKINISAAGGTAAKGAKTCKVTLPTAWVEAMGISLEQRDVALFFDGNQIILTCRLSCSEFAKQKRALGHKVWRLCFYDGDRLCTTIYADFTDETLAAENHVDDPVKTAFGNNPVPNWEDFQTFLQERCIPKERAGLREYLEALDLDEYDPLAIIQKTGGRIAEDQQWIEVEDV
ncbi:MAG TPA: hypothetical protein H9671_02490 [Firmicutes bacterium]|nr:hypothetical protein [Bacillota bacterium]